MSTTSNEPPPIPDPAPGDRSDIEIPRGVVEVEGGLPFLPRTLTGQVVVPIVLVALVAIVVLSWVVLAAVERGYRAEFDASVRSEARLIAAVVEDDVPVGAAPGDFAVQSLAVRLAVAIGGWVTIADPEGTVLADSQSDPLTIGNVRLNDAIINALRDGEGIGEGAAVSNGETYRYAAVAIPNLGAPGVRLVARSGRPMAPLEDDLASARRLTVLSCLGAVIAIYAVAWLCVRRVGDGVERVREHAVGIERHALTPDLRPSSLQELAAVRSALNAMALELRDVLAGTRHARAQLESTLSTLSDGVVLTDREGIVLRINAAAGRLLDVEPTTVVGQPFVFATRDHELGELQRHSMRTGQIAQKAGIQLGFDRRLIDAIAQPVVDDENRLTLVVLRDVTELRRLEQVRREFVANVSHELRTPLASIRAMVETLEAGAVDDPEIASDFLARIVTEVERLASLVDELLDLARLESGRVQLRREPLSPADLIGNGARRLSPQVERARLTLDVDVADDLPPVLADRNRVEQVLLNLVHNAIKFTPPGGRITITAEVTGNSLAVDVRDTGVGIPADELPRLFERFYKADRARRSEGTGLGLAITKHIVMGHGGTITVRSVVGEGSVFTFTLPLAHASPSSWDADRFRPTSRSDVSASVPGWLRN